MMTPKEAADAVAAAYGTTCEELAAEAKDVDRMEMKAVAAYILVTMCKARTFTASRFVNRTENTTRRLVKQAKEWLKHPDEHPFACNVIKAITTFNKQSYGHKQSRT